MGDSLFFALKRLWDSTGGWTVAIMDCTGLRLNASSILSKSVKNMRKTSQMDAENASLMADGNTGYFKQAR
ncbi:Uncharacterised protein [Actinobacillus pleuropneumoniae]|nr:Uncharacterised protein [Actinobacillus pleuropneumoniae]